MNKIVIGFVTGQQINAASVILTPDFKLWIIEIRFHFQSFISDYQLLSFRLPSRTFNSRLRKFDFDFAVCFSYYRILSFRLLASDFKFPFSTFGHSISEFGVYFQPLTYNFFCRLVLDFLFTTFYFYAYILVCDGELSRSHSFIHQ